MIIVSTEMIIVFRELIHDTVDVDTMRKDLASNFFGKQKPSKGSTFSVTKLFFQLFENIPSESGTNTPNDLSSVHFGPTYLTQEQDATRKRNLHGWNKSRKFSNGT